MSDFHHSLDRAIANSLNAQDGAPLTTRHFTPDPLENPSGLPAVSGESLAWVDEITPLKELVERINRDTFERLQALQGFAICRRVAAPGTPLCELEIPTEGVE